jgi:hypothetical protein
MTGADPRPGRLWRSVAAVLAGFVAVVLLSLGTDQVLRVAEVYPPWGEPMNDPGLNLLALAYRCVYAVAGSYVTARLAPYGPMRHVWVGGAIGFAISTIGAVVTIPLDLGPAWYPIALAATALPCARLGGTLHQRRMPDLTGGG